MGRYRARLASAPADVAAAQDLRRLAFVAGADAAPRPGGRDVDPFDEVCRHVLVEDPAGKLVCTFRALPTTGDSIGESYSALSYDLSALAAFPGALLEIGRFCIRPGLCDPDVLRAAWGAVARLVDERDVTLLFGCSSFRGTDPDRYAAAFSTLREHVAPPRWRPGPKAREIVPLGERAKSDSRRAMLSIPPLLRSYLTMGGWVSDHAVVDRDLDTLHVFTGLEVASIPAARARFLRAGAA